MLMIKKRRWFLLLVTLAGAAYLSYRLFHDHEIRVSLDEDWDAFLMSAGAMGLFSIALIQIVMNNAEILRQMSLKRASEEANDEKNRFLRRLDHEMKNPLTAIQAALANLETHAKEEDIAAIYQTIDSQSKRLAHLVRDLRVITDLDQQGFNAQPISIQDLFDEIAVIVQEELGEKRLSCHIADNLPVLQGDYDLLLAALYNLVNNAIKYTGENGLIQLSADYDAKRKRLVFSVKDNGQGISETDLLYVWDELFRSEKVREIAGSGIGLALVRAIAVKHQGEVAIESEVGKGTKVRFQIPLQLVTDL